MVHSTLLALALSALAASAATASASAAGQQLVGGGNALVAAPARSRHAGRSHRPTNLPTLKRRASGTRKCKASSKYDNDGGSEEDDTSSGSGSTVGDQQNNSTDVNTNVDWDMSSNFLKVGNIFVGMLPDDGSGGGKKESMAQLNAILPAKAAWYGRYAQVTKGKTFDGSQLYSVLDDVKQSGAILAASVMPYGTWYGLTESDNRNAVAIAKVCNDIYKNHGVEVWLRFAHEMNWYQTDGTYSGGVSDFQTGWKVLSKAIEEHAPETKLWWSPNVGSDSDYEKYYPKEGRVDVVGVSLGCLAVARAEAYDTFVLSSTGTLPLPRTASCRRPSLSTTSMQRVTSRWSRERLVSPHRHALPSQANDPPGLHYTGSDSEKMQWVKSLSSSEAQSAMPNYLGWMQFNYDKFENGKRIDFKLVDPSKGNGNGINQQFVSFFSGGK